MFSKILHTAVTSSVLLEIWSEKSFLCDVKTWKTFLIQEETETVMISALCRCFSRMWWRGVLCWGQRASVSIIRQLLCKSLCGRQDCSPLFNDIPLLHSCHNSSLFPHLLYGTRFTFGQPCAFHTLSLSPSLFTPPLSILVIIFFSEVLSLCWITLLSSEIYEIFISHLSPLAGVQRLKYLLCDSVGNNLSFFGPPTISQMYIINVTILCVLEVYD